MLPKPGIEVRLAKSNKPEDIASLIDAKTKAVFCESIGNPAGNIIDIEPIAAQAHAKGVPLIVDNTVATPILLNTIDYGADIVVPALTKYIGSHGNFTGRTTADSLQIPLTTHNTTLPLPTTTQH